MSIMAVCRVLLAFSILILGSSCTYDEDDGTAIESSSPVDRYDADDDDDDVDPDDDDVAPRPDEWGAFGVGYRHFEWTDEDRNGRRVPTIVYYPSTLPPPAHEDYEAIKKNASLLDRVREPAWVAVPGAEPANGPFPVVVFSHGSGGRNIQYKFLAEFLASHGYVVAAPNHVGNAGVLHYMPFGREQTVHRLFDVMFALDRLTALFADEADPLYGAGDADDAAVMGHSYGGNIALALGGAEYSWDYIAELCADDPADPYICPVAEQRATLEPLLPDPRVRAVVSLAHDGAQSYFGPDAVGAAAITVPVLLVGTDGDAFCPYEREAAPTFERLGAPSYMLHFFGASHLAFTDVINLGPTPLGTVHAVTRGAVVAFFDRHLKGADDYSDDLDNDLSRLGGGDIFEWFAKGE